MKKVKWGQHFLRDKKILKKIAERIFQNLEKEKIKFIVEIGAGKGELTEFLLKNKKSSQLKILAIEKEKKFCEILKKKFEKFKNLEIFCADIRDFFNKYFFSQKLQNYLVCGNLPYFLAKDLILKFLEIKNPPKRMVFLVQKEVGERICAKVPKMDFLSLKVQSQADVFFLMKIKKEKFSPRPKVDGALIEIFPKKKNFPQEILKLAKLAFSQKRKILKNTLKNVPKEFLNKRPQELSLEDWKKIWENEKRTCQKEKK